jgi:agmatinase
MTDPTSTSPDYHTTWSGLQSDDADAEIGLLGVPFDSATSYRKGASFAPARIRAITPYIAPSTEEGKLISGLRVKDYGDIKGDLNWDRYFAKVEAAAREALNHPFALFIGGDHSVTIPLMAAFSKSLPPGAQMGIVHFDSHLDLADVFEGHRWSHACTERRALELPNMQPRHLSFTGIRSWMGEELAVLAQHPEITVHPAREVYTRGIEAVAHDVVTQLAGCDAVYFTLDIDGLDPAYAPGTGTPEAGGPSMRELLEFARIIFANLPVRAMDVVEVSPPLDTADITSQAAIRVIYEVFGWVKDRMP